LFDRYEEKEVSKDEASDITLTKTGSVVKKLDNGNYLVKVKIPREELKRREAEKKAAKQEAKRQKDFDKLHRLKDEITDEPPENQTTESFAPSPLEEELIGPSVNFEIGKSKKGKRVVIVRGKIPVLPGRFGTMKNKFFFAWDKGAYLVRLDKLIEVEVKTGMRKKTVQKVRKLVYDVMYLEPLNEQGKVYWDDEAEEVLTDSGADQYITAATFEGGFQLTPQLIKMLIVVGVLGGFLGLALNGVAHFTPITQVHWVP
jgi:hypothetical protein